MSGHLFTLHKSEIFYFLRLLIIYHQVTPKNYLETVVWCKDAFYMSECTVFISIWRAARSNSRKFDWLRKTPRSSKRVGVANQQA